MRRDQCSRHRQDVGSVARHRVSLPVRPRYVEGGGVESSPRSTQHDMRRAFLPDEFLNRFLAERSMQPLRRRVTWPVLWLDEGCPTGCWAACSPHRSGGPGTEGHRGPERDRARSRARRPGLCHGPLRPHVRMFGEHSPVVENGQPRTSEFVDPSHAVRRKAKTRIEEYDVCA